MRGGKKSLPSLVETGATGTQADTFSGDWKVEQLKYVGPASLGLVHLLQHGNKKAAAHGGTDQDWSAVRTEARYD